MAKADTLKLYIHTALRTIGIFVASLLALLLLITLLLYLPPVQNLAVRQVSAYASETLDMEVGIDHVQLAFPLDLELNGTHILKPTTSTTGHRDTIAYIHRTIVDVQLLPLLSGVVNVDELSLGNMVLNTDTLIHEARISGRIKALTLASHGIDLGHSTVTVDKVKLDGANLDIALSDTVPPDTTQTTNLWKIAVKKLEINQTALNLHMPGDTLRIGAQIAALKAKQGYFDLYNGLYRLNRLDIKNSGLTYDNRSQDSIPGFDYNHIALQQLALTVDSVYYCAPRIEAVVRNASFVEKSGFSLTSLNSRIAVDSLALHIPSLSLTTPYSYAKGKMDIDFNAFDASHPGKMNVDLQASFGQKDIVCIAAPMMPKALLNNLPGKPINIDVAMSGNMQKAHLAKLGVNWPTVLKLNANGFLGNITDVDHLYANINLNAETYHLNFITKSLAPTLAKQIQIPYGVRIKSQLKADGSCYNATLYMTEGKGTLQGKALIDTRTMAYNAQISARNLQTNHFVPTAGVGTLTASLTAHGVGTDMLSPKTRMQAQANITQLDIAGMRLGSTQATVNMAGGNIKVDADGNNALFKGQAQFIGIANGQRIRGTFVCNLDDADFCRMGFTKNPLNLGVCSHIDIDTNLKDRFVVLGNVGNITLQANGTTYHPEDIEMDILATQDTTHAVINSGDFRLDADASGDYNVLLRQANLINQEVKRQTANRYIDQIRIRQLLPKARIFLNSGRNNVFSRFLKWNGYEVARMQVDVNSSPEKGINGIVNADSLVAAKFLIDTVRITVTSDSIRTLYQARISNNKQNPDYTFTALLNGGIFDRGAYAAAQVFDADNKLGLRLGLAAAMQADGIRLHLYGDPPILGYKQFTANDDNYILFGDNQHISANLKLTATDGMGVQLYSDDDNTDALQDLTLSLAKFDLHKVLSVIPYTPDIEGMMNGDFHIVKTEKELSVSSAVSIDNMIYEKCPMGNLGSEFVYMPKDDGSHYVDGMLYYNGDEVSTIRGTYKSENEGWIDATLGLQRLPMQLINGFIPDRLLGLRGYGEGSLNVRGKLSQPIVDGEVYLDSTYLFSEPYGVQMRFADDPVRIVGSKLLFENFEMFANNDAPLNISGNLDFSDLDNMMLDIRMRAENFKIIDAKENLRSEAYGKAFVNFFGMMNGPLDNLRMRGKLDVLGNTDMTYVMRDAELTTDTQLDELVHFINFRDTTKTETVTRPAIRGLDMQLTMSVDESAHIMCMLNADHSNYISVIGGGDLRMAYNPTDNLTLTGRYTLYSGEMKYSLPIIPLKTFAIQDGSYIEFTGDPMNPQLNITATESVKTTVSEGSSSRAVDFDCGVKLTQTLNNLGLEFIIDAPNDMTISDQLKTLTTEGRSKVAVTMLASGMYLTDGNTSQFTMNNALSSFLQNEINNVAGKAMRSIGLDLGMSIDNTFTSEGMHTDYNFKFSKRLWNNRLSVNVGGKVSTGSDIDMQQGDNNMFFNNVELEYRLDKNASKYLRVFYDNNKYDWLEGALGEYGVGFVWKRKLQHFRDIFSIEKKQTVPANPEPKQTDGKQTAQPTTQNENKNDKK